MRFARGLLIDASKKGDVPRMKQLLACGADMNEADASGLPSLCSACLYGQHQAATLLLDRGATVDMASKSGKSPLFWACYVGCEKCVKLLLERGASVDVTEIHPLLRFKEPAKVILRQWQAATPARRDAVRRHGWEYIDVPYEWTIGNHSAFPESFREKIRALCMAWQAPIGAFGKAPARFVELQAEGYHRWLGLQ